MRLVHCGVRGGLGALSLDRFLSLKDRATLSTHSNITDLHSWHFAKSMVSFDLGQIVIS
jgi:hypothetical protein